MRKKKLFKLKEGKNKRYILFDVGDKNKPYTSVLHFASVNDIKPGKIYKMVQEFLDLGWEINKRDRVTKTFDIEGFKLKITILNY